MTWIPYLAIAAVVGLVLIAEEDEHGLGSHVKPRRPRRKPKAMKEPEWREADVGWDLEVEDEES